MSQSQNLPQNTPLIKPGQIDLLPNLDPNARTQYKNGLTNLWNQYDNSPKGSAAHTDAEAKIRTFSVRLMAQISGRPGGATGAPRGNQQQGTAQTTQTAGASGPAAQVNLQNRPNSAQQNAIRDRALAEVNAVTVVAPSNVAADQVEKWKNEWKRSALELLIKRGQRAAVGRELALRINTLRKQGQAIPPEVMLQSEQYSKSDKDIESKWTNMKGAMQQYVQLQSGAQQNRPQQSSQNPHQPQPHPQVPANQGQAGPQSHAAGNAATAGQNQQQRAASTSQQPDVNPKVEPGTAGASKQLQGIPQTPQQQQQQQQQAQPLAQPQPQLQTKAQTQAQPTMPTQLQQQRPQSAINAAQQQQQQQPQSAHAQQPLSTPAQQQVPQGYPQQNALPQPSGQPQRPHINTQVQGQIPQQPRQIPLTAGIPNSTVQQNPPQSLSHQAAMTVAAESYQRSQAQATHPHQQHPQHPLPQQQIQNGVHFANTQQPQSAVQPNAPNSAYPNLQTTPQSSVNTKFPIPKTLALDPRGQAPVAGPPSRPTLSNQGMMYNPGVQRAPPYTLEGEGDRVLSKRKLDELVRQITGSAPTDGSSGGESSNILVPEVEESIMQCADDFVDDVITAACRLAKLRPTQTLDIRDIQIVLERNYGIRIPGYSLDEVRTVRKFQPAQGWQSKMQAIQAGKVMGNRDA